MRYTLELPFFDITAVELNDWVVVAFETEGGKVKKRHFLGQLLRCENGEFIGTFLRSVFTKNFNG